MRARHALGPEVSDALHGPSARGNATGEGLRKEEFVGEFGPRWDKQNIPDRSSFSAGVETSKRVVFFVGSDHHSKTECQQTGFKDPIVFSYWFRNLNWTEEVALQAERQRETEARNENKHFMSKLYFWASEMAQQVKLFDTKPDCLNKVIL